MTASETKPTGLTTTNGKAVPLQRVEVSGQVFGSHTQVSVRQHYRNSEQQAIEAVYTFPLPADATLTGFSMQCAARQLEGQVREREEAFRMYDDAVLAGHGAALLEQERPNVFTASVGNLLPGEDTVIEVQYLQRVTVDEGALRWMLPTLVAPRYIPGTPTGDRSAHGVVPPTDRVPDADRISPPRGEVDYKLTLDLLFDLGRVVEIESPSHPIAVQTEENHRVRVRLSGVALDRDVVVVARTAPEERERPLVTVAAHREPDKHDGGFFALTVVPDLLEIAREIPPQEVVFVIDTSGSMAGTSLPEAQAALRLCLRHLKEGDKFNIIAFNSTYQTFAKQLVPFTQTTLAQADAWVRSMYATGGTEILEPLLEALGMTPNGVVVLLTDGQVGNEVEILEKVNDVRKHTRIYSFGIGTNVSDALLRGLARQSGGTVECIYPGERIDEKVVAQFARAVAPRITDVTVKFRGVSVEELAPANTPALVDGEPWVLFGRYDTPGFGHVEIRGKLYGEPFVLEAPIELPQHASRPTVAKLWAAERIRDFEALSLSGRRAETMKKRIADLAVKFGIASNYTSFVVVEKRTGDRLATGFAETRVVPVNLPAGWAMFRRQPEGLFPPGLAPLRAAFGAVSRAAAAVRAAPSPVAAKGFAPDRSIGAAIAESGGPPPAAIACTGWTPPPGDPSGPGPSREDPVRGILERQLASGLWDDPDTDSDEEIRIVRATARALYKLLQSGVNTSHPLYGTPVRKAIKALLPKAITIASREPKLAEFALGVAWLIATGKHTRHEVETAIAREPFFTTLRENHLVDETALRTHVDRLAAGQA